MTTYRSKLAILAFTTCLVALAGCTSQPVADIRKDGDRAVPVVQSNLPRPQMDTTTGTTTAPVTDTPPAEGAPSAQLKRGSGEVINRNAASAPPPNLGGSSGAATFNFEGESLHAVVKAILGDMLGQNYVIAPGVQGTVTLATPRPVSPAQAMSLLEQVLGWNNARMVYADGRYNIVAADAALSGTVAPRTGSPALARGYEARVIPLRFISAEEMKKVLTPYARPNAIITTDNSRNVITVAGTRAELENYMRTIEIFDVDWLQGMSVGVFPLKSGKASKVVADLEKVFGEASKSPVAGMFRFMPLDGANAVLVITSQPRYLDEIQSWLDRIEGAGGEVQLFSYELKYVKAKDLADRLAQVFGGAGRSSDQGSGSPSLMPGLESTEIKDAGVGNDGTSNAPIGGDSSSSGGGLGEGMSLNPRQGGGNGSVTLQVNGDTVGVAAVDETNTLLVRANAGAWQSIRDVIERLDTMPLQVHIEAQVAEVKLSGDLRYGVNWYFENAIPDPTLRALALGRSIWGSTAGSAGGLQTSGDGSITGGLSFTFLGPNAMAVVSALDRVTDVNILQTPSVLVRNNAEATFNVGSRIPISSVSVNTGTSDPTNTISQVQYLDTGTILKVRPRITKDGMVFLDIVQEVSTPGSDATADANGNVRIDTRRLKTEAAIQSGETVMLAGLIQDTRTKGSSGVPGLSRIPWIGGLFGTQSNGADRTEVIVLLTPTIIRNPQEARDLTDEYGQKFRALEPLYRK
ncbi:general secretion pathway protein D [Lysobacter dokdonensis DS-58]|uniref:General secretion pathway protein D n=1 Tax=Lysobacter dokdonensis DS-58 TaxID=1300345 RepID=A0A0A2WM05_9GAMM|nr:type II secretion system secretin GspD [Lysobacter dokdonensis]KGQ20853.1 general secretion pathway protein D [Lysobacter dokdonensis DS-58]